MKVIKQKILRLSRRPEARHVGILTSGSVAAQVLLVGTSPWLSRLYSPASFGVFSLLLTISTIIGAAGALCYEAAIILPRSGRVATSLYQLAFLLSLIVPVVMVGIIAMIQRAHPHLLGRQLPNYFWYYCLVATVLTTQINILSYAHSRAGQYGAISVSKITQTLFPAVAQIGLACMGLVSEGLLLGRGIGLLGSELWLCRRLPRGFRLGDLARGTRRAMIVSARSYKDFLFQVPRQFLVRGATMLPAALILSSYGPTAAGLYFFAQRLIERPGMLLGDSLTRVPMKQFAARVQKRSRLTRAALIYTAAVGIPVILGVMVLALIAHPVFRIIFGHRWEPAADISVALAGWAAIRLASLPMATLTTVLRVPRTSFYVDALSSLRVVVIPVLASHHYSALTAISAFCGLSVIYHLVTVGVGLFAALRYDRGLLPAPNPPPRALDAVPMRETYG